MSIIYFKTHKPINLKVMSIMQSCFMRSIQIGGIGSPPSNALTRRRRNETRRFFLVLFVWCGRRRRGISKLLQHKNSANRDYICVIKCLFLLHSPMMYAVAWFSMHSIIEIAE